MTGISIGTGRALAEKFPWDRYHTVVDIGTAQGCLPVQLALAHPNLRGGGFDLPSIRPIFEAYADRFQVADRLRFYPGDFFTDELPTADVLVMGHILPRLGLDAETYLADQSVRGPSSGGSAGGL